MWCGIDNGGGVMKGKHCYAKDWDEVMKGRKVIIYRGPLRPNVYGEPRAAFWVRLFLSLGKGE
jgi:hypothetical protein